MKKLSVLLLALLLVLSLASCDLIQLPEAGTAELAQAALDAAFGETELEITSDLTLDKKITDAEGNEYEIAWAASSNVTLEDGEDKVTIKVTQDLFEDQAFAVAGAITVGDATAKVNLTYTVPALVEEGQKLADAAVEAAFAEKEFTATESFKLADKLVDAKGNEYALTWVSSDENLLKVNGANVEVAPNYFGDAVVTLTGTATKGQVSATVVLTYTVPGTECEHDYELFMRNDPTCTEFGNESYRCKDCGRTYMLSIPVLPHNFVVTDEVVAPTCEEDGYTVYACTVCGTEKKDDFVDALGHDWALTETVEAQPTAHGYNLYTCGNCEGEAEEILHAFVYEYEYIPATCTEPGTNVMICYVCATQGTLIYDPEDPNAFITVPATGHTPAEFVETVAPTCTEVGYDVYTCENCDETVKINEVPATGVHVDTDDCICDYDGCEEEVLPEGTDLTVGQALYMYANKKYDANTYYNVTGTVESIANTTYGNLYIKDAAGNKLYVYGVYSAQGTVRFDKMPVKPAVGDVVTLNSKLATYNNAVQLSNARIVHECERDFACSACVSCGETKGAEDHTGGTATCQALAICEVCGAAYGEKAGHVYGEDGNCTTPDCTAVKPAGNVKTVTITATTLGISNTYANGNKTVDDVAIAWTQLYSQGDGIQMRYKNSVKSQITNSAAFPGKIVKIELTYNAAKATYSNTDMMVFNFGNAAGGADEVIKLSTVQGQTSYVIEPTGDWTFFTMINNLSYTSYWDSIVIYYEAE